MNNKKFLHEKVYDEIKDRLLSGYYSTNSLLPREVDLMEEFEVSRHTIRKAMDRLKSNGFIRKIKGTGTFVNHIKPDYDYTLSNMTSFSEIIRKQGGNPNSIILSAKLISPSEEVCNRLSIDPEDPVYYIERLRRNDDEVLCYEITYVVASYCPDLDDYISPKASLYNLYEKKYNLELGDGLYKLEAINAPNDISKILKISINSALLYMDAVIFLNSGVPLYYVKAYYIGSKYRFSTKLTR
ncbi:GntR family transcriptional regulator [Proteiniclasticum sp. SCR006]|uniref:GntR family transcriptional regulator n=1 Tax=Proteiniclasticum aestuarii TaxID=2817862 RepID=A0A939HB98_9CLOT|nr:GntR family transcriptional regulator [Proteiniclasticum aestuarii]MBO1264158.1 GntR family transcriptional regulator [Proteiniclasticum aestuarii]